MNWSFPLRYGLAAGTSKLSRLLKDYSLTSSFEQAQLMSGRSSEGLCMFRRAGEGPFCFHKGLLTSGTATGALQPQLVFLTLNICHCRDSERGLY